MIVGGTDGAFHALQVNTGKPVWSLEVSKRAILGSALFRDNLVYITHGEENIDTTTMGMIAAVDPRGSGALTKEAFKWVTRGFLPQTASPVMDADAALHRLTTARSSAPSISAPANSCGRRRSARFRKDRRCWPTASSTSALRTASSTFSGRARRAWKSLDEDLLGQPGNPEPVDRVPGSRDGRVYVTTMAPPTNPSAGGHLYAIGKGTAARFEAGSSGSTGSPGSTGAASQGAVAQVQVFPYEALLDPGAKQALHAEAV